MPARLSDDGREVTLDLHGCTLAEAEALLRRTARLAAARGRTRLVVIHGASTSSRLYRNATIRHALHEMLDRGALAPHVTGSFREEGRCLLALDLAPRTDPRRITLADVAG